MRYIKQRGNANYVQTGINVGDHTHNSDHLFTRWDIRDRLDDTNRIEQQ